MNNSKSLKDYFTKDELQFLIDSSFTYNNKVILINTKNATYEICCDIGNKLNIYDLDNDIVLNKAVLFKRLSNEALKTVDKISIDY